MSVGWCMDVEVQAVLRHGDGQQGQHSSITRYCEVLWTPGPAQGKFSAGYMQWPKLKPGSQICLDFLFLLPTLPILIH